MLNLDAPLSKKECEKFVDNDRRRIACMVHVYDSLLRIANKYKDLKSISDIFDTNEVPHFIKPQGAKKESHTGMKKIQFEACSILARSLYEGIFIKQDKVLAKKYFARACEFWDKFFGDKFSCDLDLDQIK